MNSPAKLSAKALKDNRKIKIFLFFLVLTSIIWFLIALSKIHTSSAVFKIEYTNLPSGKLLQNKPISEIKLTLKGTGFSLLKFKTKQHKVAIDLFNVAKKNEGVYYVLPNNQLAELNSQLVGETEIIKVLKDTVFVNLGKNISKKIVVIPKVELNFKLGYNLTNELVIKPDSIIVTGPKQNLDSITEIATMPIKLQDVYEHIDIVLDLKKPSKSKNVSINSENVNIKGEVDKFTEGNFLLPVTFINVPEGVKITPFPKEINVFYQAGLSNFNKISKKNITVVFDYEQYKNDTLIKFLRPIVKQKSSYIASYKIKPSQIEFLIQK